MYILKHKNQTVMTFEIEKALDGIKAIEVSVKNAKLLPLDLETDKVEKWLKRRTIPSNRAYVSNFLAKLGLSEKDTVGLINISKGLSLNDCFWVVTEDFEGVFEDYNLYDNSFNETLASIAFTGYGSSVKSAFASSPEFTTNGMLAKCWRRTDKGIVLYKSGTEGARNLGKEPYSEFLASDIAEKMGLNAISYDLKMWKDRLCSTCILFTSKDLSFISAGQIIKSGGITAVLEYYKEHNYLNELLNMFLFDAIIMNTDRHLGNFGFLVDNNTNKIVEVAPIFDNGLSLLCYSLDETLDEMESYSKTRTPVLYDDFYEILKGNLTHEHKSMLRKLIDFKFKKHEKYNMEESRVKLIEQIINKRVKDLLEL